MSQKATISVYFDQDIEYPLRDELLIRQAAMDHPQVAQYCELVIRRRIDAGYSGARVYEAEWCSTGAGANDWSVIKVDAAWRVAHEVQAANSERVREAPSFMNVVATSFDISAPASQACLFYAHAGSHYPGPIESLAECFRRALVEGGAAEKQARGYLERTLAIVRKQVHKGEADQPYAGGHHLEFYLERWLPAAVIVCRQVAFDAGPRILRFFESDYEPEQEVELGRNENDDEQRLGHRVAVRGDSLFVGTTEVFVNLTERACFRIEGVEPRQVLAILGDKHLAGEERFGKVDVAVQVEGLVKMTRRRAYGERLRAISLDPAANEWKLAGLSFRNPLPELQKWSRKWIGRRPWPLYSFGHGDLHGGNILRVGDDLAIIDHALAGEEHPSWADAARLIGSLWGNSIAVCLTREEIALAVHQAFKPPTINANGRAAVAAGLLKAGVEASIESRPPDVPLLTL